MNCLDDYDCAALHARYRGLAHLNKLLDNSAPRLPGVLILRAADAENQGAYRDDYDFKQKTHANLLMRDFGDVVSVSAANGKAHGPTLDEATAEHHEEIASWPGLLHFYLRQH